MAENCDWSLQIHVRDFFAGPEFGERPNMLREGVAAIGVINQSKSKSNK